MFWEKWRSLRVLVSDDGIEGKKKEEKKKGNDNNNNDTVFPVVSAQGKVFME